MNASNSHLRELLKKGKEFWPFLKPALSKAGVLFLVSVIIVGTWFAFIKLVKPLPIPASSALIMVWISASIAFIVLFPSIIDRIKKLKIKDFEIEFREAVTKAASRDLFLILGIDKYVPATKGGFHNLSDILKEQSITPDKPVLLIVNVFGNKNISIPMLFIYLFFLDLVGTSITVLFVSSRVNIRSYSDIRRDYIIGAIQGKKVMQGFLRRFRYLSRIFSLGGHLYDSERDYSFRFDEIRADKLEGIFNRLYSGGNE